MKKCEECVYFKKETKLCDAYPFELEDIVCLLRCILWSLLLNEPEE